MGPVLIRLYMYVVIHVLIRIVTCIVTYCYIYCIIFNISGCACIPTVKKHALISEGVLIFECFVQLFTYNRILTVLQLQMYNLMMDTLSSSGFRSLLSRVWTYEGLHSRPLLHL